MKPHPFAQRLVTGSLLASLALTTIAPAAQAGRGHGHHKKYRRGEGSSYTVERADYCPPRVVRRVDYYPQPVIVRRSSCGGSTLAGFVGGLAVGAILSSASQSYARPASSYCPPPPDEYCYEDPYCHERFATLSLYLAHTRYHGDHPRIVRVIDVSDGDCVRVLHYDDGRWENWDGDDDWDD